MANAPAPSIVEPLIHLRTSDMAGRLHGRAAMLAPSVVSCTRLMTNRSGATVIEIALGEPEAADALRGWFPENSYGIHLAHKRDEIVTVVG